MTPAIETARTLGLAHTVHAYANGTRVDFGEEAAALLGVDRERIFKTLVVRLDGERLVIALVPVSRQLDTKQLAKAAGAKRAEMAPVADAERATGYVAGGISPLGQKRLLPSYLDASALEYDTIFVSAGRRGVEIELAPSALVSALDGRTASIAR